MSQLTLWTPQTPSLQASLSSTTPHRLPVHPCRTSTNPIHIPNLPNKSSHYTQLPDPITNPNHSNQNHQHHRSLSIHNMAKLELPPLPPPPPFYWGETPEEEYYKSQNVRNNKLYFQTSNGKIFTQSWLPLDETQPIKGVVFMNHGYRNDTSWCFQKICIAYANWGYAVYAADMLGHGRSEGIRAYVGDMEKVATTSLSYFVSVRNSEKYCKLPAFLFGESMGGLVAMLMYLQSEPDTWTGLIFSAPLFVTPEKCTPSKLHITMYGLLFGLADSWAVMPDGKGPVNAIRDPEKLKIIAVNPQRYFGKHRVGTMREVVRWTDFIQNNFDKVKAPFIALHGTSDEVTCPSGSKMLYEKASSEDKTLKLYEGMYHSLVQGEPDEAANRVLADMRKWIDEKTIQYGPKSIDI
ncbi:putative 2-acylglycerol O-acyltransferase [Helianthus annuus]|nr:putative 2-acylglycerol O-acyltransferase [Helianthus annuus]